ncbi:PREDICTED: FAS-associated death domain protein [Dipodomys ordii]|uniref:FAS-associated death domain protein n=1 Tax=Dipodomys ordii TaxID=10020 RepID=A0A1S3FIA1_DIPOR|nr:PREDICTED: FAS-associated death domain protein [Dipodomys ordii]
MDPFLVLLHSVSTGLSSAELTELKFLCLGRVGKRKLERVQSGLDLFTVLLEQSDLEPGRLGLLRELLGSLRRHDLLRRLDGCLRPSLDFTHLSHLTPPSAHIHRPIYRPLSTHQGIQRDREWAVAGGEPQQENPLFSTTEMEMETGAPGTHAQFPTQVRGGSAGWGEPQGGVHGDADLMEEQQAAPTFAALTGRPGSSCGQQLALEHA